MYPPFSLILASTSPYRKQLFERLRVPFSVQAPNTDETALPAETPAALALRLAQAKGADVARHHANAEKTVLVIGSDQVIDLNGESIGKPLTHARAVAQLRCMRGATLLVQTGVAVVRARDLAVQSCLSTVRVQLRDYSDDEIETYLRLDTPYDCAGAIKSESLGIALIEKIESNDPTSLIGLPLTDTLRLLRLFGYDPLAAAA
jgi:septum formation protein